MSVINTTYNFNQQDMNLNLGQGLMYGVLGALTGGSYYGGGNCCTSFGSYGMNSIFPYGTMATGVNCYAGMSSCTNSYAGAQVGMAVGSVIIGAIGNLISRKSDAVDDDDVPEKTDAEYEAEAEKAIDKKYDKNIEKAEENFKTLGEQIRIINKAENQIILYKSKVTTLKADLKSKETELTAAQKIPNNNNNIQSIQDKIDELSEEIKKIENEQIKEEEAKIYKAKETIVKLGIPDLRLSDTPDEWVRAAEAFIKVKEAEKATAIAKKIEELQKADAAKETEDAENSPKVNDKTSLKSVNDELKEEAKKLKSKSSTDDEPKETKLGLRTEFMNAYKNYKDNKTLSNKQAVIDVYKKLKYHHWSNRNILSLYESVIEN